MNLYDRRFNWIRTTRTLSCAQKGLLCIMLHYLGDKQECWPANATLAEDANLTEKSVMRHLRHFQESGLLTVTYGRRPRGGTTGRILHFHFPDEPDEALCPLREDNMSPGADEKAPSRESARDNSAPPTCHSVPSAQDILSPLEGTKCPAEKVLEFKKSKKKKNLGCDFKKRQVGISRERSAAPSSAPLLISRSAPQDPDPDEELIRTIMSLYDGLCTEMIPAGSFTAKRKEALKTLCEKFPLARRPDWWETYLERASRITLFTGGSKRGWRAGLDWLLLPWTARQVLDGRYDDHMRPPGNAPKSSRPEGQNYHERSLTMNAREKAESAASQTIETAPSPYPQKNGGDRQ